MASKSSTEKNDTTPLDTNTKATNSSTIPETNDTEINTNTFDTENGPKVAANATELPVFPETIVRIITVSDNEKKADGISILTLQSHYTKIAQTSLSCHE